MINAITTKQPLPQIKLSANHFYYILGILFSVGSYSKSEERFVFCHRDIYYLNQLKNIPDMINQSIYKQLTSKSKTQFVLKSPCHSNLFSFLQQYNWKEYNSDNKYYPKIPNQYNSDFLRSYFEIHSSLGYGMAYNKQTKQKYYKLRLRIYGNKTFVSDINSILSRELDITLKTLQISENKKTAVLSYQSYDEIKLIYNYIENALCNPEYWNDVHEKLLNPTIDSYQPINKDRKTA
jgi:hypothetical protein